MLQADPATQVAAAGPDDRITTAMIHGIVANARRLSADNEDWAKTLMAFPGGEIACKSLWQCRLSLPDGRDPPEQSLDFELIMAKGDERFILVTQMVYGRSEIVYGLHWREGDGGGEVVEIFPELE